MGFSTSIPNASVSSSDIRMIRTPRRFRVQMLPRSFNLMSKSYNWIHLLCLLPWLDQNLVSHIFQLSIPWIWSVGGLSTQSFSCPNDVRGFGCINRSLPNVPPEGTIHGAFTATPITEKCYRPISGITTVILQSYKKHSLLALCSLLYATYGFSFRQEELTDRRLVELAEAITSILHLPFPYTSYDARPS